MTWRVIALGGAAVLVSLASACSLPQPEKATIEAQPAAAPTRTITGFTEGLRCMDRLFAARNVSNVLITSTLLPDDTGSVKVGTVDMLVAAISKMSEHSHALIYVDYTTPPTTESIPLPTYLVGQTDKATVRLPEYFIRGGISQFDQQTHAGQQGVNIVGPVQLNLQRQRAVGAVSLDLQVGLIDGHTILPGITSDNTVVLTQEGQSGGAGAWISKAGINFSLSNSTAESSGAAVRTLIELGTIELFGKLFKVPYWQCLQIDSDSKFALEQQRDWYDGLSGPTRLKYFRAALEKAGYNPGPVEDFGAPQFIDALSRYQADNDLVAVGKPSFETFAKLEQKPYAPALPGVAAEPEPVAPSIQTTAGLPAPLQLSVQTTERGNSIFKVNSTTSIAVTVSRGAFVGCFHRDVSNTLTRLYPNRFQPENYVPSGTLTVPKPRHGNEPGFDIVFDKPGIEEIVCLASEQPFNPRSSPALAAPDLEALRGFRSLDEIVRSVQTAVTGPVAVARTEIRVGP